MAPSHNSPDLVAAQLKGHEDVCAERYKQIIENQNDSKADRLLIWNAVNGINAKLFAGLVVLCMILLGVLGTLIMLFLKVTVLAKLV